MHANDGTIAEDWIIERGGWQLDRVNKAIGYMLGTTQADQQVSRVLSGWKPKEGARLPSLLALDPPLQSKQIDILIQQNKRLEERVLAVESNLRTFSELPSNPCLDGVEDTSETPSHRQQHLLAMPRAKKKGSQMLSRVWFEWFTADPRVYASNSVKKTTLYEMRHVTAYLMLFLPQGFALYSTSAAYKDEVSTLGEKTQENALTILKANGSLATAAGTALKTLRKMRKLGKFDQKIALFTSWKPVTTSSIQLHHQRCPSSFAIVSPTTPTTHKT
ncbi:hypothetical protein F444_12676 [Phytophthora nicotianae P1976]|uniref:Uncharacterized protein n=1 Tax=Phytophthora nicotianae P1976 TaxID=1317066 RepID=A0A080ZWC0_PHYNI|nr:hypothetical protein F444_12676 [Phytophthora nicotianae P1976]